MEMKVTKLIAERDNCTLLSRELKMFCDTGAEQMTMTREQAAAAIDILAGYKHLLNTLIDNASVYI